MPYISKYTYTYLGTLIFSSPTEVSIYIKPDIL